MKRETYQKLTDGVRNHPKLATFLIGANKAITYAIYIAYPALLIYMFATRNIFWLRAVLVPLISFVAVSIARLVIDEPRPYEEFGIPPVLKKETKGKSFPSRHVFSIVIIGMTFLLCLQSPVLGVAILILSAILAVLRVVLGVHYPRDVLTGAAVAVICAWIGFLVI